MLGLDRKHIYLAFMCGLTFIHSNHLCAQLLACDIAAYKAFVEKFQCYVMVIMTFVNKFGEASALQVLQGALNVKFSSTFFSEAWIRKRCHC